MEHLAAIYYVKKNLKKNKNNRVHALTKSCLRKSPTFIKTQIDETKNE